MIDKIPVIIGKLDRKSDDMFDMLKYIYVLIDADSYILNIYTYHLQEKYLLLVAYMYVRICRVISSLSFFLTLNLISFTRDECHGVVRNTPL